MASLPQLAYTRSGGSAFYLLLASISRDARAIAVVSRHVVIADWRFSATTVVLQPLTGLYLMELAGMPFHAKWIMWSFALYALAVGRWLPVVWI